MKHTIRHGLDHDLARKATRRAFDSYKERFPDYNPQTDWVSDDRAEVSFAAKGLTLEGVVEVAEDEVLIDLDVPFILKPFSKKAVDIIDREIQEWISRAKRGELD